MDGMPVSSWVTGQARAIAAAVPATPSATGRVNAVVVHPARRAERCGRPRRNGGANRSTRGPRRPRTAGSSVSDAASTKQTASTMPSAIDRSTTRCAPPTLITTGGAPRLVLLDGLTPASPGTKVGIVPAEGVRVDGSQVLKGLLDLAVLTVLARSDDYGYAVVRQLREAGLEDLAEASVYGTLRRLSTTGAVGSYSKRSSEGPPRKYFTLTSDGRRQLHAEHDQWQAFVATMRGLADHERAR